MEAPVSLRMKQRHFPIVSLSNFPVKKEIALQAVEQISETKYSTAEDHVRSRAAPF